LYYQRAMKALWILYAILFAPILYAEEKNDLTELKAMADAAHQRRVKFAVHVWMDLTDRGVIAEGWRADLIAVEGNPLENVSLLEKPAFVMKPGKVYKQQ